MRVRLFSISPSGENVPAIGKLAECTDPAAAGLAHDPNAERGCHRDGVFPLLTGDLDRLLDVEGYYRSTHEMQ